MGCVLIKTTAEVNNKMTKSQKWTKIEVDISFYYRMLFCQQLAIPQKKKRIKKKKKNNKTTKKKPQE